MSEYTGDANFGCFDENTFYREARKYLDNTPGTKQGFALYAMEIENFRIYNLWHGREAGHAYVAGYAGRLKSYAEKEGGVIGCFGDSHFAYLVPEKEDRVNELQAYLNEWHKSKEESAGFHPMIGIYHIDDVSLDVETMYDRAALALDGVRGNYAMRVMHYNPDMDKELDEEIVMLSDIRRGLKEHEFTFYLQPKCDMRTGEILGAEALVRWIHKEQGLVPPGKFIPILEKSGFTVIVDQVVWEDVIAWQRKWIDAGKKPLPVSVNISKTDLFAINVPDVLIGLCAKYNVPHHLVLAQYAQAYRF